MTDATMPKSTTEAATPGFRGFWRSFGPGLIWAATAIGVSHLVQATRAGATLGLSLSGVILLALVLKYPFFEYGPRYAAATGMSLIEGYRRVGRWALWLYLIAVLTIAIFTQASITLFAGHLVMYVLGLDWSSTAGAMLVYGLCAAVLVGGKFRALDIAVKIMIGSLTICTLIAAAVVLPRVDFSTFSLAWPTGLSFAFLLALKGWMPSDIAASVYSSLWTIAKDQTSGATATVSVAKLDFRVAYLLTSVLAFAFLILGAGIMYGSGDVFSPDGAIFSVQLIDLYSASIGEWIRPVIVILAVTTMLSTALTVLDGFPRVIDRSLTLIRLDDPQLTKDREPGRIYWGVLAGLGLGVAVVLSLFRGGLTAMIDVATGLAFLIGPVFAYLNLRAVTSDDMPPEHRPGRWMRAYSYLGLTLLGGIALAFLVSLVGGA